MCAFLKASPRRHWCLYVSFLTMATLIPWLRRYLSGLSAQKLLVFLLLKTKYKYWWEVL